MLVAVVAHRAEVVVGAVGALPADTEDGLLPARVAYGALVFGAWRRAAASQLGTPLSCRTRRHIPVPEVAPTASCHADYLGTPGKTV